MAVSPTWMNWYTAGLVHNDNTILVSHDFDWEIGDGRLMAVNIVCDNITVPDNVICCYCLSIDLDTSILDSTFLWEQVGNLFS